MVVSEDKTRSVEIRPNLNQISSKPHISLSRMTASTRDRMEDDPLRSKASWIPDLRSQEDWDSFLENKEQQGALNILEIYYDWAGPCHAMTRYIKKIKMELGEERDLKFIMANADLVPSLHPFRGSCKPVWLLIAAGEIVSVLDGPNVTLLRRKVLEECHNEELISAGARSRASISIQEAVPKREVLDSLYCNLEQETEEKEEARDVKKEEKRVSFKAVVETVRRMMSTILLGDKEQDILELISEEIKEAKKKKEDQEMIEDVEETEETLTGAPVEEDNLSPINEEVVNEEVINPENPTE